MKDLHVAFLLLLTNMYSHTLLPTPRLVHTNCWGVYKKKTYCTSPVEPVLWTELTHFQHNKYSHLKGKVDVAFKHSLRKPVFSDPFYSNKLNHRRKQTFSTYPRPHENSTSFQQIMAGAGNEANSAPRKRL